MNQGVFTVKRRFCSVEGIITTPPRTASPYLEKTQAYRLGCKSFSHMLT